MTFVIRINWNSRLVESFCLDLSVPTVISLRPFFATMKLLTRFLILLIISTTLLAVHGETSPDKEEDCELWAGSGECDSNPDYMLLHCATSCAKMATSDAAALEGIESIYQLKANDLQGKEVDFSQFKDRVLIITNVASFCGYTHTHYTQLVELDKNFKKENLDVEILAFPCNQFGKQEPGGPSEIGDFCNKHGVEFKVMEKIDVNGPDAHIVYKWLKSQSETKHIKWNFATYFVVSIDGTVEAHHGIEPKKLHHIVNNILNPHLEL